MKQVSLFPVGEFENKNKKKMVGKYDLIFFFLYVTLKAVSFTIKV